ncbi:MAG: hypothetical protein QG662_142 [Pseudomonadota bacterium]|nr:hypothetical protein [Pseudomonadota bacterium]
MRNNPKPIRPGIFCIRSPMRCKLSESRPDFLLFWLWIVLAFAKRHLCVLHGLSC